MTDLLLTIFYQLSYYVIAYGKYLLFILVFLILLWVGGRIWLSLQVTRNDHCPKCNGVKFMRVHRYWYERIIGFGMHARRYHCENPDCGWEGLRRHKKRGD